MQGRGTGIFSNAPQTGFAATCLQFGFWEDFFSPLLAELGILVALWFQ